MHVRLTTYGMRLVVLLLVGCLGVCLDAALPAWADDGDTPEREVERGRDDQEGKASAVSRLSATELALVKKRVPTWDSLDTSARERIARSVLHLRRMTKDERNVFHQRLKRFKEMRRRHPKGRRSMRDVRGSFEVANAFGRLLLNDMPGEVQRVWKQQGLSSRMASLVAWREFQSQVRNRLVARVEREWTSGDAAPAWVPAPARAPLIKAMTRFHKIRAAGNANESKSGIRRARHAIGRLLLSAEHKRIVAKHHVLDANKVARAWMHRFPEDVAATRERLVREGASMVRAAMERHGRGKGASGFGGPRGALSFLRGGPLELATRAQGLSILERMARHDTFETPEKRAAIVALLREQLHTHFGVPVDTFDALPGVESPQERRRAFGKLIRTYVMPKLKQQGNQRGRRRGRDGRRGEHRGERRGNDRDGGGPPRRDLPPGGEESPR